MSILVNKIEVTDEEIGQEMQYHPAQTQEAAWHLAAQSLVIRQLLLQQAAKNGMYHDADPGTSKDRDEKVIDQLLEKDVAVPEADEATCRRFYDNHPNSFMDKETGKRQSFTRAQSQIRDYLHTKAMRIAVAEYIKALSHNAVIKGFDL
jgi:hypothetical protein